MFKKPLFRSLAAAVLAASLSAAAARADVFNMGNGLTSLETVPVGNAGNEGDVQSEGTFGSVSYAYRIGKYEVTSAQYAEFLSAVAGVDAYGLYNTDMWSNSYGCKIERFDGAGTPTDPYQYRVAPERANRPVNFVSWGDAVRFSNWLHNGQPTGTLTGNPAQDAGLTEHGAYDLNGAISNSALMDVARESDAVWFVPTEDEWYKGAYHKNDGATDNYFEYPTANDSTPSNKVSNPAPDPGNNANFLDVDYAIGAPYWITEVGEFENSESPYDTFDQGGNVLEWNEAVIGWSRGVRGGSWGFHSYCLGVSTRRTDYPLYEVADIGFRVASVPEPGSITLLLCGLMAGLIWWRRAR